MILQTPAKEDVLSHKLHFYILYLPSKNGRSTHLNILH